MYCNTLLEGEVYCNRNCIVGLAGKEIISQYSILYCDMGAKGNGQGCIAIQPLHLRHGLALCLQHGTGAGCRGAGRAGSRRALGGLGAAGSWGAQGSRCWAREARRRACVGAQTGAGQAAGRQGAAAGAGRTAWALPVRTGTASWVLVHPTWFSTWFFDSVFS